MTLSTKTRETTKEKQGDKQKKVEEYKKMENICECKKPYISPEHGECGKCGFEIMDRQCEGCKNEFPPNELKEVMNYTICTDCEQSLDEFMNSPKDKQKKKTTPGGEQGKKREIWTTIRRWTPQKETYYRSLIGHKLQVEINE